MRTYVGTRQVFHANVALFKVQTARRGAVYLCVRRSNYLNDDRTVVEVDASRFLDLWRMPSSSHRDIALGNPITWRSDRKFRDAEDGFMRGRGNPVPLAEVDCSESMTKVPLYRRNYFLQQKITGYDDRVEPRLGFSDGVTRTIWLLTAGATRFPVECSARAARFLDRLAGSSDSEPQTVSQLIPD